MKLLDKIKSTFFEEEYVEVEEPKKPSKIVKPKEVIAKKIVEEKKVVPEKEEIEEEIVIEEEVKEVLTDKELLKENTRFKYFEDDDFVEKNQVTEKKEEIPTITNKSYDNPTYGTYSGTTVYSGKTYAKTETKKAFQPTPIISPIYGVLDKNYTKEEIIDRKDIKPSSSYVSRKNADLDSVRQKAFGDLANDLGFAGENEPKIEEEPFVEEDNLLYDMNDIDTTPAVEKVTIADAEEYFEDLGLEYNIDYKDTKYERAMGRRVRSTPEIAEEPGEEEQVEVEENKSEQSNEKLEDNLFELIDSMYEDKE